MNVEQLKIMLELQALQNFNSTQTDSGQGSMFEELLTSFLAENGSLGSLSLEDDNQLETFDDYVNKPLTPLEGATSLLPVSLTKLSNSKGNYDQIIEKAAEQYNIPVKLLQSVIKQESNFNPNAISYAGASGLMQLMPDTAKGLGVKNIFDPEDNIFGGAKYLRQMLNKYDENIDLALAAYNAGPGNVDKHRGVPPFKETLNYVQKIKNSFFA